MNEHERFGHATTDARKRRLEEQPANFDEQHAHLHEWPEPDVVLGEE